MTPQQVKLVQTSWKQLYPHGEELGQLLYQRMFELDPGIRSLFGADIKGQGNKLVEMLGMIVDALENPRAVFFPLQMLGDTHRERVGITSRDYQTMKKALLWAFAEILQDDFTEELESAWAEAYALITQPMMQGSLTAAA